MEITEPGPTDMAQHPVFETHAPSHPPTTFTSTPTEAALELSVEIAHLLSTDLPLTPLLSKIAERIRSRLDCPSVSIYRFESSSNRLTLGAQTGVEIEESLSRARSRDVPQREALRQRQAVHHTHSTPRTDQGMGNPLTCLSLPLMAGQTPVGVLTIVMRKASQLSGDSVTALQAVAEHLATAITHAERLEQERRQRRFAEKLKEVGRELSQTLDLEQILEMVLGKLAAIVPNDRSSILLEDNGELVTRAASGFPDETDPLEIRVPIHDSDVYRTIGETLRPLSLPNVAQRKDWHYVEGIPRARSWLGVPLVLDHEAIGMLSLIREHPQPYSDEEVTLSAAFANQAALALHNADLYSALHHTNLALARANADLQQQSQELEITNRKLKYLDQAKSDFITIASHELRTPLTVLSGYSQMLMSDPGYRRDEYRKQLIAGIQQGTERLMEIVENLFDMTRIDNRALQLSLEPMFLSVLVQAITSRLSDILTARRITLDLDSSLDALSMIEADTESIRKVFYHLVVNAIKYTPDGGTIRIWGRPLDLADTRPGSGWVEVVVSDTGIGIDPSVQELIFDKFYQTGEVASHSSGISKFKGGGPGLGLTIVRGIVEAHGGRVWVESPGHDEVHCPGSDFHVILPIQPDTVLMSLES